MQVIDWQGGPNPSAFRTHRFRRTFALWMPRDGCDLCSLRMPMRHRSLPVPQRYGDPGCQDIQRAHMAHSPGNRLLGEELVSRVDEDEPGSAPRCHDMGLKIENGGCMKGAPHSHSGARVLRMQPSAPLRDQLAPPQRDRAIGCQLSVCRTGNSRLHWRSGAARRWRASGSISVHVMETPGWKRVGCLSV